MGVCGIFISYTSYTAATHAHTVPTSVISYTYMLYMCACLRPRLCYENCHIIFYNELIALHWICRLVSAPLKARTRLNYKKRYKKRVLQAGCHM